MAPSLCRDAFVRDSLLGMAAPLSASDTAPMTRAGSRTDFAGQLKQWRLRCRVSQLDLAIRAGTTQRYLSFLEQGRSRPGRAMVVRLAESLDLPLRDRNGLLLAAGFAPVFPESSFATAIDVTLAELHPEAFLPADEATARILRARAE